jgi:DNA-3-methyladenine glycosylase II
MVLIYKMKSSFINFQDSILQQIVGQLEVPFVESTNHVFHDVISCIIEQQIHYRITKNI